MRDMQTRADIDALLRDFYTQLLDDALLRHVFVDVARMDLEEHLPVMGCFWEKVLFNSCDYNGQVMRVHPRILRTLAGLVEPDHRPQASRTGGSGGEAARCPHRAGDATQPRPGRLSGDPTAGAARAARRIPVPSLMEGECHD